MAVPENERVGEAADRDARSADKSDVPVAARLYLLMLFAVLTMLVWALPGPVRISGWLLVGPISLAVAVLGAAVPQRGGSASSRWLRRAQVALGLVLAANVLVSFGYVALLLLTVRLPLG